MEQIECRFKVEWAKDRALRLFLILIDSSEGADGLDSIAGLLEPLLDDANVIEFIECQLLHRELPAEVNLARAKEASTGFDRTVALICNVANLQDKVRSISGAFDALPVSLFDDDDGKLVFRETAINLGVFRTLVLALGSSGLAHHGIINAHSILVKERNSRQVVTAWTRGLKDASKAAPLVEFSEREPGTKWIPHLGQTAVGAQQQLRNALEQQDAILSRVAAGDFDTARRFAADLERQQLARGDHQYLAMSFTRMSQYAREMEAFELDVEWSRKAVDASPEDARARTQMADALLQAGFIEEAVIQFAKAEELGERAYALGGRARAMRALGEHVRQLSFFEDADQLLQGSDERVHTQVGIANALADLHRWEAASDAFKSAEELFPYDALPRVAHGWVLLKRGKYDDAWGRFEEAEGFAKDKSTPLNGLAEIRRRLGYLADAHARFSEIIRRYPRDPAAYLGLIDTLRDQGRRDDAFLFARQAVGRFPGSPRMLSKVATTASECGKHAEARRLFVRAIDRYPRDSSLIEAQIAALIREGAFEMALQVVDAAIQRFTKSVNLVRARADVLRRLKNLNESRPVFQEIYEGDASDQSARNALASILILENELDAAESLLTNDNPRSSDEWSAFLLRAVVFDRWGDVDHSAERLLWAIDKCPFPNIVRLFKAALANQALRHSRARSAPRIERVPVSDVANVIDFQVAAATKRRNAKDAFESLRKNISPALAEARDAIAFSYGVVPSGRKKSKTWLGYYLNDEIVLAAA